MLTTRELVASLYGAYRLARFDPRGLGFFDSSPAGARRSFFAAGIVAPFYTLMLVVGRPDGGDVDLLRFGVVEGIAYVLSWVAYPVMVEWLTRLLGCRERFKAYLVAYNWSMVLQNAVVFPITMLAGLGVLPLQVGQVLWFGVFLLILLYVGFIARAALEVTPATAAGLVLLDVLLSALIDGIAGTLYRI
jgi:hypothetical protein